MVVDMLDNHNILIYYIYS